MKISLAKIGSYILLELLAIVVVLVGACFLVMLIPLWLHLGVRGGVVIVAGWSLVGRLAYVNRGKFSSANSVDRLTSTRRWLLLALMTLCGMTLVVLLANRLALHDWFPVR